MEGPAPKNGCHQTSYSMEAKLCSAWRQLAASKDCFRMLKQDLLKGMAEANDIFNSMSVPLVRLVGLKMQQLSEQGRQTSVCLSPPLRSEILQGYSPPALCSDNRNRRYSEVWQSSLLKPEESMTAQAAHHVAEFSLLQKQQLRQLVGVVKMVERLVRSEEETISEKFQDLESYFVSLQQSSLVNFKNLHQQVMDMRQQDSRVAYRLRVAEQSYQALMSLAVKVQESAIDKARKNLLNVKTEVEGMVNELASSMCKPLVAFLKELKGDNDASMVVSKLQRLIAEMDSRVSSEFQTLATANDEYKAQVKKMDSQLQVCNRQVEKMSLVAETLRRSLKEKVEEVDGLKMVLAVEAAEKQKCKAQLDDEVGRACQLEEELRQKERKLANAVELLQVTKLQVSHQHLQLTDVFTKSSELCSQLAAVEDKVNQTHAAVDSYLNGDADVSQDHEQRTSMEQPCIKQQQVCSEESLLKGRKEEFFHLWHKVFDFLSNGMAEKQSSCSDKVHLQDAVVLFTKHYGKQENLGALIEAMKEAVVLFTKHLENRENSGAMKEENCPSTDIFLEQLEKNSVYWLSELQLSQSLVQHSQQTQDSRKELSASTDSTNTLIKALTLDLCLPLFCFLAYGMDTTEGLAPTHSCTSISICSDICSKYLGNLLRQLYVDGSGLSKTSGIFSQLAAAVAKATMSKLEHADSQLKSCCNGSEARSQQQEQQRKDMVQHEREEVVQHDAKKIKLLRTDMSSGLLSCEQGLCGSKRSIHSGLDVEQEMLTGLMPFSAKKVRTHNKAVNCEPESQVQSFPSPRSVVTPKMIEGKEGRKDQSTMVIIEGQKDCQSISLSKARGNQSTLLLLKDGKGRPNQSKELWHVLELGTDISCNETMNCFYSGEVTALEPFSTRSNQHSSEPLLVLKDDVQRPPRPFSTRASPRLLARQSCKYVSFKENLQHRFHEV